MSAWSIECRDAEWLDGAVTARPGARFRGRNRRRGLRWSRTNEVLVAEAPKRFVWRTVPSWMFPDSTEWSADLEPHEGGTRVVQSLRLLRVPAVPRSILRAGDARAPKPQRRPQRGPAPPRRGPAEVSGAGALTGSQPDSLVNLMREYRLSLMGRSRRPPRLRCQSRAMPSRPLSGQTAGSAGAAGCAGATGAVGVSGLGSGVGQPSSR